MRSPAQTKTTSNWPRRASAKELIESRAPGLRAADFVRVFVNDLEAALLGQLAQVIELGFGMLIDGTDSEIKRRSLHQRRPFRSCCGRCFCT